MELDLVESFYSYETSKEYDIGQANANHETHSEQETAHDGDNEGGSTFLAPGQIVQGTGWKLRKEYVKGHNESHPPLPNISLTTQDVTRWKMAARAHHFNGSLNLVVLRCENSLSVDAFYELLESLSFSAAALIYGGLHALAWFAHFDSPTEQLLWRISACVVMGGSPVIFVFDRYPTQLQIGRRKINRHRRIKSLNPVWNFLGTLIEDLLRILRVLILLAYIQARAYLVVECFINLSNLPAGAYDVPTWSAYVPHIA